MNLCYIQARGGSKRFPGKNIADWYGQPLIMDAISKARRSGLFDAVMVSSDDFTILRIAMAAGALPAYRSEANSADDATDDMVAKEVLGYFSHIDMVCKLYPCVPLLAVCDLQKAWIQCQNLETGIYSTDMEGKDAGAFYIFKYAAYKRYGSIKLDYFPWHKYRLKKCVDINFIEDLEKARSMAHE